MKLFLIGLAVLAIALAAFIGFRLYVYEQYEPYRTGVSALKEGNYKLALELLEPYARNGNLNARLYVGKIYTFGVGIPADTITAQKWFDCAGLDGCTEGFNEYSAALEFEYGIAGIKYPEKARYWMLQSSRKGYKKADDWLASQQGSFGSGNSGDSIPIK